MPLFGSQRKRNERLFTDAFGLLEGSISQLDWDAPHKDLYVAWFSGGSLAANHAVDESSVLKSRWGKGDKRLALHLTQVFTMPMVPRFFRWNPSSKPVEPARRYDLIQTSLENILQISPDYPLPPEETVGQYLRVVRQFDFEDETPGAAGNLAHSLEMDYILSRALVVLGYPTNYSMASVKLPVDSLMEFMHQGGVPTEFQDPMTYTAVFDAVHLGAAVVAQTLTQIATRPKEESD